MEAFTAVLTRLLTRPGLGTTSEERLAIGQNAGRIIHDDLVSALTFGLILLATLLIIVIPPAAQNQLASWKNCGSFCAEGLGRPTSYLTSLAGLLHFWWIWLPTTLDAPVTIAVVVSVLLAITSGRYAAAAVLFGITRIFPARPARFLEWARDSGLLRVTGVAYQFRHDTYGEWLAGGGGSRDVTVRSDTPADARSD